MERPRCMWELVVAAVLAALPSAAPAATPPSLVDLPRGEPPAVGYVRDGVFHGPGGRRVEVPDRHGISSITPYDGGFLIGDQRIFEGSIGLVRVDADGQRVGSWASSGSPAVGSDGSVAWTSFAPLESGLTRPSLVHVGGPGGCVTTYDWPGRVPFAVAGFVGDHVMVDAPFQRRPVALLAPSGSYSALDLATAADVSGTLVAGNVDPDGDRSGVVDAETGELLWSTALDLTEFSPSGRRIAGIGRDRLTVFDSADGRVLWQVATPVRFSTHRLVWADERQLLAVANNSRWNESAVVRLARDGTVERATAVDRGDIHPPPYVLATQP